MNTQKLFMFKSSFNLLDEDFSTRFVYRTMFKIGNFFWVFVYRAMFTVGKYLWVLLCNLFEVIIKHLSRSRVVDDDDHKVELNSNVFSENENSEFSFGFKFQNNEDFVAETGDSVLRENGSSRSTMSTSKYQFMAVTDFGGFIEKPKTISFTVHELFMGSGEDFIKNGQSLKSGVNPDKDFKNFEFEEEETEKLRKRSNVSTEDIQKLKVYEEKSEEFAVEEKGEDSIDEEKAEDSVVEEKEEEFVVEEKTEDSVFEEKAEDFVAAERAEDSVSLAEEKTENSVLHGKEDFASGKKDVSKTEQVNWLGDYFSKMENFSYGVQFLEENEFLPSVPQPESDSSSYGFSTSPLIVDLGSSEFSSEEIDDDYIELEPHLEKVLRDISGKSEETMSWNSDPDGEVELESHLENSTQFVQESLESEEFSKFEVLNEVRSVHVEENSSEEFGYFEVLNKLKGDHSEEKGPMRSWESDIDSDDSDVLGEHQELIDQMKMEMKMARTGGLPTILEECETPKMLEDLKPLKIDEKLEHRDRMAEIHKFYKSYTEKMRKLDVLNYQTLQAISFLRMKQPDELNSGENLTFSAIKTVLLPNFWPCKLRRIYADPTLKSITELQRDLEVVYVGQTCLSWEILRWQYVKVQELQQHDPQGYRSYNQVAIEFQQFQVLLQRFNEDQPFQEPRIKNYVNKRCILRGLLQVPAIKDDCLKDKKARRAHEGDTVSISMLAEIINESMKVFWVFLRADKDITNLILSKVLQGTQAYLQDPADSDLLVDIKSSLRKKEKRLKDILRTGNCIVKKFQKHEEGTGRLDHHLFLSQVELRLVSRVLSLPRLSRDQLVWCQTKLNNINFVDRKIHVETLFLLFPC